MAPLVCLVAHRVSMSRCLEIGWRLSKQTSCSGHTTTPWYVHVVYGGTPTCDIPPHACNCDVQAVENEVAASNYNKERSCGRCCFLPLLMWLWYILVSRQRLMDWVVCGLAIAMNLTLFFDAELTFGGNYANNG